MSVVIAKYCQLRFQVDSPSAIIKKGLGKFESTCDDIVC